MMFLREHARRASRLSDFLPWAALIAPGIILNKDGSFLRIARFRGPDLDSATQAELIATSSRLNSASRRSARSRQAIPSRTALPIPCPR
jgi:type IV secretion system protein VirB4